MRLARSDSRFILLLLGVAALGIAPEFAGAALRDAAFTFIGYAVLAQGWNLIGGFGGQFSLGNSVFVGFGAYTAAWLLNHTALPPILAVIVAAFAAIPFAWLASLALFRLHGIYFSVGSLALALAVAAWMANWPVTGATQGLNISFERVPSDQIIYLLSVMLAVLSLLAARYFSRSDFGFCVQAVRDDEDAATSVGVSVSRTKTVAFAASASFTSAMGALVALRQISIEPTSMFGIGWTINMIVMTVLGGIGTVWGPFLGAVVVYFGISKPLETYQDVATLATGTLLIAVVRFMPHGLIGAAARMQRSRLEQKSAERQPISAASL